ncbi:MAG: hypothetical protein RLZZ77_2248 [Bacteroidota bacterium]|jgi:hypothetical protein
MSGTGMIAALFIFVLYIGLIALMISSMWKIFAKANQPGWAAIVPIYNAIICFRIIRRPKWWILLYLAFSLIYIIITAIIFVVVLSDGMGSDSLGYILGLNNIFLLGLFIISILDTHRLSKAFGKGIGFTLGLLFLSFIFLPILAFGDAQYQYGDLQNSIDTGALDSNL